MHPDPPRIARAFGARILPPSETITQATPLHIDVTNMLFHAAIELIYVSQEENRMTPSDKEV